MRGGREGGKAEQVLICDLVRSEVCCSQLNINQSIQLNRMIFIDFISIKVCIESVRAWNILPSWQARPIRSQSSLT